MALGASSSEIILSFGKRGLVLTLAGLAAGLLSAGAARLLTALLYGFHPDYAPTATLVSLILLAVASDKVILGRLRTIWVQARRRDEELAIRGA